MTPDAETRVLSARATTFRSGLAGLLELERPSRVAEVSPPMVVTARPLRER